MIFTLLDLGLNLCIFTIKKTYDIGYYIYYRNTPSQNELLLQEIKKLNEKINLLESKLN